MEILHTLEKHIRFIEINKTVYIFLNFKCSKKQILRYQNLVNNYKQH